MPQPTVIELLTTAHAREVMDLRGITLDDLADVLANRHIVIRNRKDRAASHILIGRDERGRCLAVPVAPTDHPYTWRAVTVWPCKPSEAARLR